MRSARAASAVGLFGALLAGCPAVDATTTGAPPQGGSVEVPNPPSSVPRGETPPVTPPSGPQGMLFDSSGRLVSPDSGPPPPTAMRADRPLQAEPPAHEEQAGVTVDAQFRMRGLGSPPKVPEVAAAALAKAQKLTALTSTIDLFAVGRMRWSITSRAMPLPFHSELRAKYDRWGHIVLWPSLAKYRVLPAGSLRAVLDEARVDVMPIVVGTVTKGPAGKRLGETTRGLTIESPVAKVQLEIASIPEAALGGPLLCRTLLEIAGVDPASPECKADEIVLAARFDFAAGGGIDFDVTTLGKRTDMAPADASCPPAGASYEATGLPESSEGVFLVPAELEGFRSKSDPKIEPGTNAPSEGIIVENALERRVYFALDGVLLALVPPPPQATRYVLGMPKGRYTGEWRTFLGEVIEAPHEIILPGRFSDAPPGTSADAGAP